MKGNKFSYLAAFLPHIGVLQALLAVYSWQAWTSLVYMLVLLPIFEIILGERKQNLTDDKVREICDEKWYDILLYIMMPLQYSLMFFFLYHVSFNEMSTFEYIGNITSMGVLCGTVAINVSHELGHRSTPLAKFFAKALLLSSSYLHFYIEHNRGHHKHVATKEDPATARYGESVYAFWIRSIYGSYISAWKIENDRMRSGGQAVLSFSNEMIRFLLIQLGFMGLVFAMFGWIGLLAYLGSALMGILLLETINYIQHYGLLRKKIDGGQSYERVQPKHSWNSSYFAGRALLFELGRHSDHHYKTSKKYQILEHKDMSPQMPTGYSGMVVLALFPPLWFRIMNRLVKKYN